ncbi:MAG: hypothetical protein RIE56_10910 [Amphiplicatus sp.]
MSDKKPSLTGASPVERFRASMNTDYEKWRDGIGYDLQALREASPAERAEIERLTLAHQPRDWRDIEALVLLDSPAARAALHEAVKDGDPQTRMAVTRHAPGLVTEKKREASLVRAIRKAQAFDGLSAILDEAEAFHPPAVIDAMLAATLKGDGEAAVSFAALLYYLHGKAESSFDWAHRPFFLRFNTDGTAEREAAFRDLCAEIGKDADAVIKDAG